jgi:phosphohistidine phosphatase
VKSQPARSPRTSAATACSLYLVRHAIAHERGPDWPDDTQRPLTHKGAARMRQVVAGLRGLGVEINLVLTSPLVRAEETAKILSAGLRPAPEVVLTPSLAPGESPAAVGRALESYSGTSGIALVGHEPDLGVLAAWLIGAAIPIEFKKGGVCRIDVPALPPTGRGQLRWFATPKMLRGV